MTLIGHTKTPEGEAEGSSFIILSGGRRPALSLSKCRRAGDIVSEFQRLRKCLAFSDHGFRKVRICRLWFRAESENSLFPPLFAPATPQTSIPVKRLCENHDFRILFIGLPIARIGFNVTPNGIPFFFIVDDVFVIIALPNAADAPKFVPDAFGDRGFETNDERCQRF